jgi:5'-3' exonuclease
VATVHLVDASPYIFRAYFAMPSDYTDATGAEAGAVFGFASFLLRYLEAEAPTHLGVAFDESLNTSFRNELYPEYKAQRELPPPALEAQQKACQEAARVLGAAVFVNDRYEADDLIATAAAPLVRAEHDVVVVTTDKDLMQLVSDRVTLFDVAREVRYDPAGVKEKLGVRPTQVPDFLGLAGDSVDNIPGVPRVGPKTAVALLEEFDDLEALYAGLERVETLPIRGACSLAERLREHRDLAFLSRELATVAIDAPVGKGATDLAALERKQPDMDLVREFFENLGSKKAVERVQALA